MNISVIIPAFNAEKYIDKCLDYLLNQDYKLNYEIIIVDDGSKDETLKILKKYEKKHSNIKVISQKNSGQAVARNRAIDLAKGKYLMFVDIDDFVDKTILSKMFSVADKENADLVYCDYYEYYGDDKLILKENYFTDDSKKNGILANFAPWGKLYRTEFFKKSGLRFLEGKLFEDIAIVPVLAALSNKSIRLAEPLYYYNCSNVSSIRKKTYNKKLEDVFVSIEETYNNFKSKKLLYKYYDEIEFIYLNSFLRGSVMRFADFKVGIPNITRVRKTIREKFPKILSNIYYKNLSIKEKLIYLVCMYMPPRMFGLLKRSIKCKKY